jgi:hypothetical protein
MEETIAHLRLKYESFKRNEESALAVRTEAYLVLGEAQQKGKNSIVDEVEDMLLDLESYLEENRCNCNRNCNR